ncbi:MAG TPA: YtxH domain-containing protein [Gemmatimonadales bacterium]|jgi:gas vesicle protein
MADDRIELEPVPPLDEPDLVRRWDPTSFLTGALLGAAVGAAIAVLFSPASGARTRRLLGKRVRALTRGATEELADVHDEVRQALREKKESIRARFAKRPAGEAQG